MKFTILGGRRILYFVYQIKKKKMTNLIFMFLEIKMVAFHLFFLRLNRIFKNALKVITSEWPFTYPIRYSLCLWFGIFHYYRVLRMSAKAEVAFIQNWVFKLPESVGVSFLSSINRIYIYLKSSNITLIGMKNHQSYIQIVKWHLCYLQRTLRNYALWFFSKVR